MDTTTTTSSTSSVAVSRDAWGALTTSPEWVRRLLDDLDGRSWTTGIESDRKRRGSSINTSLYSYDEARQLALVQVRQCIFHPRRYSEVKKDYYLIGRNEIGTAFAHPVDVRAAGRVVSKYDVAAGVRLALTRIWDCAEEDLDQIVRNGDVAFIPVSRLPEGAELVTENAVVIRESHHVQAMSGAELFRVGEIYYVRGRAKIEHAKHQHPTARVRGGIWRVQAGIRAANWGFTAPTAD